MASSTSTITVGIAAYNAGSTLEATLDSVLAQTYADWQCVVYDDASQDDTAGVVRRYVERDARFLLVGEVENCGAAEARNRAVAVSEGEWLAFLDADDWWEPAKLEKQLEVLQTQEHAVLSYHQIRCVYDDGGTAPGWGDHDVQRDPFSELLLHNFVPTSSVMLKRSAFEVVGGFLPEMRGTHDWDLWLRVAKRFGRGSMCRVSDMLTTYRVHGQGLSGKPDLRSKCERWALRRALVGGGWFLRHPLHTLQVVDAQVEREINRYGELGREGQRLPRRSAR